MVGKRAGQREAVLVAGEVILPAEVRRGVDVLDALDGHRALELAREHRPALIVVSAALREPGPLELLRKLAHDEATKLSPAVVVIPVPNAELETACLELGAADVLLATAPVPVQTLRLMRAMREGLEKATLADAAQRDALTGLSNFRALTRRLHEEFTRASRYGYPLTAVMLDLDHLKELNDELGHEAGNRAIVAVARHLGSNLREADFAARFGGDEFVALLPHQTPMEAEVVVQRLRAKLREHTEGAPAPLSLSVGIAGHTPAAPRSGPEALLEAADAALYEAKRRGRNRIVVAEEALLGDAWDSV